MFFFSILDDKSRDILEMRNKVIIDHHVDGELDAR